MKKGLCRRILSLTLAAAMVLPWAAVPARAADSGTIAGKEETVYVSHGAVVRESSLNENWKFYLGDNGAASGQYFDDSRWETVSVPHDFSIIQNFDKNGEAESGFLPGGTGWYRKHLILPESCRGKTLVLNFDGVYNYAYVYVNGEQVGENLYGYNAFAFDITDQLVCDGKTENVIAVKAVNQLPNSRWYSGSGIYRDVTLLVTDAVHADRYGTKITTPDIANGKGTVKVAVDVVNDSEEDASVTVKNTVFVKGGNQVAEASSEATVPAGGSKTVTGAPVVSSPKLWSPESPALYTVKTEISVDGAVVDTVENDFGFRYYSFDSTGFHLNGKNVKLNGVCLHHDQGALGSAAYYDAMYRQLAIMKDMGVNAVRTSHNPADEDFINICNQLGLLVIEEIFDGWRAPKNGNSNDFSTLFDVKLREGNGILDGDSSMTWSEFVTKAAVKRDRNDPSVILWSIGNEVNEGTKWENVGTYPELVPHMIDWIEEVDKTRPATTADKNWGVDDNLAKVQEIVVKRGGVSGFNYANNTGLLEDLVDRFGGVIIGSETASATNSRGFYTSQKNNADIDEKYHLTSYDESHVGWGITAAQSLFNTYENDAVAGEFVWTGFDYIGEPTPWNGIEPGNDGGRGLVPNSSYFGIVDTTGFEKDTYYLYRSQWNKNTTTLHLVTAWDKDNQMLSGGKTPVVIYSNAPVVKLYRDGTLVGTATRQTNTSRAGHVYYTYSVQSNNSSLCTAQNGNSGRSLYATFNVAYKDGTLSAKAFDENGKEISLYGNSGRNSVSTPGEASKLRVTQNKTKIAADGSSLAYITVDVTDKNGNLDTTAVNTIHFSLSGNGEIVGVDNGDQATLRKWQNPSVLHSGTGAEIDAFSGKALVIVRSTKNAGSFTVTASADDLTGGSAKVTTTPVADEALEGLASYTMVRDYTVRVGTAPSLGTKASGVLTDGTKLSGTVTWNAVPEETYNTPGDHAVQGVLTFDGLEPISVLCRLHVIANVTAVQNVAAVTALNAVPDLPDTVRGLMPDGTLEGEFPVVWDPMTEEMFGNTNETVMVSGVAEIFQDVTLPVTASVRVSEKTAQESTNLAPIAQRLTHNTQKYSSDDISVIRDGVTKVEKRGESSKYWDNFYCSDSEYGAGPDFVTEFAFGWDTAQLFKSVNIHYYLYESNTASPRLPKNLTFSYSLNGSDFTPVEAEATLVEEYDFGAMYTYTFSKPISPVSLKISYQDGDPVDGKRSYTAIVECEIMSYDAALICQTSADLSGISVDGTPIEDFQPDKLDYTAGGSQVTVSHEENMGVTILPVYENVVRILTLSEDGENQKVYTVTLEGGCAHENTELQNAKNAACTEEGYTGDTVCKDCGEVVTPGETIPATGHLNTEVRNAKEATEEAEGYTGDTYCADCETLLAKGETIPKLAHTHAMTKTEAKAPTCTEDGNIEYYTCSKCKKLYKDIDGKEEITPADTVIKAGHGSTELRNAKKATCTEAGYSGDTYCTVCGKLVKQGQTINATGHTWDSGKVTKEPTETEPGVKTFTCTACSATRTESIPALGGGLSVPVPTLEVSPSSASDRILLTADLEGYGEDGYYEVTGHGFVYIMKSRLGTRTLTVNTPGRTRVTCSGWLKEDDGIYVYNMKPSSSKTQYAVRAYLTYRNEKGKTVYVYSDPVYTALAELPNN